MAWGNKSFLFNACAVGLAGGLFTGWVYTHAHMNTHTHALHTRGTRAQVGWEPTVPYMRVSSLLACIVLMARKALTRYVLSNHLLCVRCL